MAERPLAPESHAAFLADAVDLGPATARALGLARHLSRQEYTELIRGWVTKNWEDLQAAVVVVATHFPATVNWNTFDAETQEMAKTWAPKAEEYLGNCANVIFEAWIWRILVDDVFEGPAEQHWKTYAELLHIIEPLARLTPDALGQHMQEIPDYLVRNRPVGWRELMENRLKARVMLWRSLTMNLLKLALNKTSRYTGEYVIQLITRKLGRWFKPYEGVDKESLHKDLSELADLVVTFDWRIQCSFTMWDFDFKDREMDKAHGFLYKKSKRIEPHFISPDERYHEGHPVDLVVEPLVTAPRQLSGAG
ncbi:hypothetical protein C8A03DRAFT_32950 [Achaetomium macrosporum]|uniref:Uncharacterized protein n=1 Tax=Achaetomium macrosporum TaxID=79813 RepID=A0AAN7HBT0_9PEZI|nr:hypothetical protein C8A03DRAFT_32950 [Achaetomium macrosporum]